MLEHALKHPSRTHCFGVVCSSSFTHLHALWPYLICGVGSQRQFVVVTQAAKAIQLLAAVSGWCARTAAANAATNQAGVRCVGLPHSDLPPRHDTVMEVCS
jgi:hypothetical protein